MKIWCDVCDKEEALVFCSADEASLCQACDQRVHGEKNLASKHQRFSLIRPSYKESPLCDICREKKAFLFCREDRAILCRDCDVPIHGANEHTKNHTRFLLTGVRLSSSASSYPTSSSSEAATIRSDDNVKGTNSRPSSKRPKSGPGEVLSSPSMEMRFPEMVQKNEENYISDTPSISTSSISEYLETLPGWRVEDLLDPSGYCKTCSPTSKSSDQGFESDVGTFLSELDFPFWASQTQMLCQSKQLFPQPPKNLSMNGIKEYGRTGGCQLGSADDWKDDGFTVPQMNTIKKSRRSR